MFNLILKDHLRLIYLHGFHCCIALHLADTLIQSDFTVVIIVIFTLRQGGQGVLVSAAMRALLLSHCFLKTFSDKLIETTETMSPNSPKTENHVIPNYILTVELCSRKQ